MKSLRILALRWPDHCCEQFPRGNWAGTTAGVPAAECRVRSCHVALPPAVDNKEVRSG